MPRVSVVLPAFNAQRTIGRAVRSILEQSIEDIELLVVNDGSTDNTLAVLHEFRDERMRVILSGHQGVAAAANLGAKEALSPWIARMDADDFSHPSRLERQIQLAHELSLDVVGCSVRILDDDGQPVDSLARYAKWINEETLTHEQIMALRFVEFPLVNPTIMARRDYFELGFRNGDFPEDYELMLRAAAAKMRFGKVAERVFDWHDHESRLTRNDDRYSDDAFARCRRVHLIAGPLQGFEQVDLWGVGKSGKPWMRWLQSQEITIRHAYDIDERKLGETIHGVTIRHSANITPADGTPLIIAVGSAGARQDITPQLIAAGYTIGADAWFVA